MYPEKKRVNAHCNYHYSPDVLNQWCHYGFFLSLHLASFTAAFMMSMNEPFTLKAYRTRHASLVLLFLLLSPWVNLVIFGLIIVFL